MHLDPKKNIFFTSLGLFLPSIFTYIFWFVIAKIDGSEAVGITSTIVSLVIIISTVFSLDLHVGMKRLLSKYHLERNELEYSNIFTSVLFFLTISSIFASVLLFYPVNLLEIIGIDTNYYWIIVVAIFLLSYHNLFVESFISSLRSKKFFIYILLGSILRFPVLLVLYYLLYNNEFPPVLSYYSLYFTVVIFSLIFYVRKINYALSRSAVIRLLRHLISISMASWIPNIINVCGFWMGVIIVYSLDGSQAGGQFYIAVGIFSVVLFIVSGISKVTHGFIQAIDEKNRLTFLSYCLKIALVLTIPLSTSILFFSTSYLGILGKEFEQSNINLTILMFGMPFVIVSELVYYYLYGLGHHRQVLILGLAGNLPRVIIYFFISSIDSSFAALSYFVGSVIQSVFSLNLKNSNIEIYELHKKIVIVIIPFILAIPLWLLDINYIVSTLTVIIGSIILYIRLGYLDSNDSSKLFHAMLPDKHASYMSNIFEKIILIIKK